MSKAVTDLQQHIEQIQSRLEVSGKEAESQVKKLQIALKTTQQVSVIACCVISVNEINFSCFEWQKSQQYAKLIWKLRQRLANNQTQQQAVTPSSLATVT